MTSLGLNDWFLDTNSVLLSQCGNFTIFLSVRFYVKSTLGILEVQNLPFLSNLEALNFDFYDILHFLKTKICPNPQIQSPRNYKIGIIRTSTIPIIDFTYNLYDRKIVKFPPCDNLPILTSISGSVPNHFGVNGA